MVRGKPHICQLRDFRLEKNSTGLGKFYEKWCFVSDHALKYTVCFRSESNLVLERQLQRMYRFVIHPFSSFRFVWESFMALVYLVSFFLLPFEACNVFFRHMNPEIQMNFGLPMIILHIIFIIDIIINFFTGFVEWRTKRVILNRRAIALKYLTTYFFFDVLSTIPALINAIPFYFGNGKRFGYNNMVFVILRFLLRSVFFFHWASCLLIVLPFIVTNQPITVFSANTWMHQIESNISNLTVSQLYQSSLYYTLNLMLSCAAMPKARNVQELLISFLYVILGIIYECYLFIRLFYIIRSIMEPETKYDEFITQLQDYMRHNQLPTNIQQRLYTFFEHRYQKVYFREDAIVKTLSERIYDDIKDHSRRRMVNQSKILSTLSQEVQDELLPHFVWRVYLPKDVIVKGGSRGTHIYFLASGTAVSYTPSGKELRHYYDGNYFGETCLLIKDQKMINNIFAMEMCEMYLLDHDVFLRAISTKPDIRDAVIERAKQKIKDTRALEVSKTT